MSEGKRKRDLYEDDGEAQQPNKKQKTWGECFTSVFKVMYETLIASGASSELSNDNEEPELPIVDLLLQTTPPASPAKSTSPSLWDERTSDLPLISLGVVPASSVPLVTQMKTEQDNLSERRYKDFIAQGTQVGLEMFQSPKSPPSYRFSSKKASLTLVDSPLCSSPGHTPYPYRRRMFGVNQKGNATFTPFITKNTSRNFEESTSSNSSAISRNLVNNDSSSESEEVIGSPYHVRHRENIPQTPSAQIIRSTLKTPGSPKFVLSRSPMRIRQSPARGSPKQRLNIVDPFNPLPFEFQPEVIDVEAFTKPRAIAQDLRNKSEEYKKLLDEKKKALDDARKRDLLVQRIRREEAVISLSTQQEREVQKLFYGPESDVLADKFNIEITRSDICRLKPCVWLNDEVSNFFFNLLAERSDKDKSLPKIRVFNTFFYQLLSKGGHQRVAKWTKDVDIFTFDKVLIPIHVHGNHWCLAVLNIRDKRIEYYDSLGNDDPTCIANLKKYLQVEHQTKRKAELPGEYTVYSPGSDVPQQNNVYDCGVFMCKFADYLAQDLPLTFSQRNIPYFRKQMALQIVKGSLEV